MTPCPTPPTSPAAEPSSAPFALLDTRDKPAPPEVQTVRPWLDNWTGIGHVVTGMQRQAYDLEFTRYDGRGWSATFFVTGMEHSLTSATGTAWEPTPWRAVQVATREAVNTTSHHSTTGSLECSRGFLPF